MDDVKSKMYNYETPPPAGVWQAIASHLDGGEAKVIPLHKKPNKRFYLLAAASVAIVVFCLILFKQHSTKNIQEGIVSASPGKSLENSTAGIKNDTTISIKNDNVIITVPDEEKTGTKKDSGDELAVNIPIIKSGPNIKTKKETAKKPDPSNEKNIADNSAAEEPRYITVEGLQGQPVRVSSKMASLMDSSNEKNPSKPVWNKKINEWREIMKGNTLAPTPGNFLDIIELTKTLKDHK